jgi:hypothetical protein
MRAVTRRREGSIGAAATITAPVSAAISTADAATEIGPTISEANYASQNLGKAMICHQMWRLRSSIVQAECEKLSLGRAAQAAAQ